MNIYIVTSKLNFRSAGGSVEEIDLIIRTLQKFGNKVTVITAFSSENDIPFELPYRVIEERLDSPSMFSLQKAMFLLLRRYENDADIFHVEAHMFMYSAGLYRFLGGKKPVVAFFNQYLSCWEQYESSLFPRLKLSFLKKIKAKTRWLTERVFGVFLANRIDLFSFVSPTLRTMYEDFGLRHAETDVVVGDPIDTKKIMRDAGIAEDSYSKRADHSGPIILFYSSRMSPGKGFDILLSAFSRLKNKEAFHLVLGGKGPEETHVRAMIKDLNLEKYVELPGWVSKEQLYQNYKKADIFIQADWWPAGTSISLIYALAFGVPSILPGGGGLEWNAKGGALYFPYRDVDALARIIERLGSSSELRKNLSRKCYERLGEDEMNPEKQIYKLDGAIRTVLALEH
ncbi:MAG: glycosyltransferase family 4 protein [Candidatus Magasanikbacteria bacterium]|nr:glycosyltransferase family 4 protein [Candidatus Magasanikbacteria bacterium]